MKLRPAHCYRRLKRAYTRKSKYKKKSFIKSIPPIKIARFDMGDAKRSYNCRVDLLSKLDMQIRENCLESARQVIVRRLEIANKPFHMKLRVYPHHRIRENKMITGAGADRMSQGMALCFGRVIGSAAQVRKGQAIFSVYIDEADASLAEKAYRDGCARLPFRYTITVTKLNK